MAKYSGWKKRYSYLNDYKPGIDGKYVYYGRHYIMENNPGVKKYKGITGIADILLIILFIVGGLMDAGIIWGTWYVVIPYAIEALGLFLLLWKNVSFLMEKYPLKEYIYNKTVNWFKPVSVILAGACILSFITTIICIISNPDKVKILGTVIYLVIKAAMALVCIFFIRIIGKYKWCLDPSEELEQ